MGPKAQALMGLALVMGVAAGCTTGRATARPSPDASSERRAMTLVNLHPDEARAKLTTVNYQQEGLIPVCTPVTFVDEHRKYVAFTVDATGREYRYWLHRALREPFADHLALYFGDACDRAAIDRLGPRDQEGIRSSSTSRMEGSRAFSTS